MVIGKLRAQHLKWQINCLIIHVFGWPENLKKNILHYRLLAAYTRIQTGASMFDRLPSNVSWPGLPWWRTAYEWPLTKRYANCTQMMHFASGAGVLSVVVRPFEAIQFSSETSRFRTCSQLVEMELPHIGCLNSSFFITIAQLVVWLLHDENLLLDSMHQ